MKLSEERVRDHCRRADAAFDACLEKGLELERAGNVEQSAQWAQLAGRTASRFGHSCLCSAPLEALLARLGRRLVPAAASSARRIPGRRERWLHVFTQTSEIGGHTAFGRRWMEHNPFSERHSVVLTGQAVESAEPRLLRAVERSGGRAVSLAGERGIAARALRLRELASSEADVVVVNVHPWDVLPALAFAAGGGPPVLHLNHADDLFWVGAAAADLVIDFRDSGRHLTGALRGVHRSAMLPIPLPDLGPAPVDRAGAAARLRDPSPLRGKIVLLSIGRSPKYRPIAGLSFPAALKRIVRRVPECAVVVVGPRPDTRLWSKLHAGTGGRVVAAGTDPDLGAWHAAADLYLEGFPVGSHTALLEVALAGRPFVRKPLIAPRSDLPGDEGALAGFAEPGTVDAYIERVVELCGSSVLRQEQAAQARAAVRAVHCGAGWAAHLAALQARIPAVHEPADDLVARPLPASLRRYWGEQYARTLADPLEAVLRMAAELGLAPRPARVHGEFPATPGYLA